MSNFLIGMFVGIMLGGWVVLTGTSELCDEKGQAALNGHIYLCERKTDVLDK